jgi:hypothetical protein
VISLRLKLIEKNSEMLYLSLGFYHHFVKLFFINFIPSMRLLFKMMFRQDSLTPVSHNIKNDEENINISALISTINMTSGLLVTNLKDNEISIHAANKLCLDNFNLRKTQKILQHINDDNLV